jgi:hypothetical protein
MSWDLSVAAAAPMGTPDEVRRRISTVLFGKKR